MASVKEKSLGKERLERIVEMCAAIESGVVEPFALDVDDIIGVVREYFPRWRDPDELRLDAEVLNHLANVVKLQSEWVRQRSSSLYTDPFLLEEKILHMSKEELVDVFLGAWSPVVEFEQISLNFLAQGLLYWESLAPVGERWKGFEAAEVSNAYTSRDELVRQRVLSDKEFSVELNSYWQELKDCVAKRGVEGKIKYWDFVGAGSYEETVQRAFLTSFLVSYGYATLEVDRLEELVFIVPFERQHTELLVQQSASVPIAVSFEDWQKWTRGELD